jgi:hypothetical protein
MFPIPGEQIAGLARGQSDAQLKFVIDLCDQNSYTYHAAGTNRVADMVLGELK